MCYFECTKLRATMKVDSCDTRRASKKKGGEEGTMCHSCTDWKKLQAKQLSANKVETPVKKALGIPLEPAKVLRTVGKVVLLRRG